MTEPRPFVHDPVLAELVLELFAALPQYYGYHRRMNANHDEATFRKLVSLGGELRQIHLLEGPAVSPAEDGVLIYGFRTLVRAGIDGSNPAEIPAPQVSNEDAILSIAVNPTDPAEMAFATYERVIWRTRDGGAHWDLIGIPAMQ